MPPRRSLTHFAATRRFRFALLVACALWAGCGQPVDLPPEIRAHLDAYEALIEEFEPKFEQARGTHSELVAVSEKYSRRAKAWLEQLKTVAPNPTEEEGAAIKREIDRLNRRAERMLRGG